MLIDTFTHYINTTQLDISSIPYPYLYKICVESNVSRTRVITIKCVRNCHLSIVIIVICYMSSATFARRRGQASDVMVSTAINPRRQRAYGAAEFSVIQLTCMSRYFLHRFCTRVCYVRHSSYYILLTIQNMILAYMHDIMHGINLVTLYS